MSKASRGGSELDTVSVASGGPRRGNRPCPPLQRFGGALQSLGLDGLSRRSRQAKVESHRAEAGTRSDPVGNAG